MRVAVPWILLALIPLNLASDLGSYDAYSRRRVNVESLDVSADTSIPMPFEDVLPSSTHLVQSAVSSPNRFDVINGIVKFIFSLISLIFVLLLNVFPKTPDLITLPIAFFILASDILLPAFQLIVSLYNVFSEMRLKSLFQMVMKLGMNFITGLAGFFRTLVFGAMLFYGYPAPFPHHWDDLVISPSISIIFLNVLEMIFEKAAAKLCRPKKQP